MSYDLKDEILSAGLTDQYIVFGATSEAAISPRPAKITALTQYILAHLAEEQLAASAVSVAHIDGVEGETAQDVLAEYRGELNTAFSSISSISTSLSTLTTNFNALFADEESDVNALAANIAALSASLAGLTATMVSVSGISGLTATTVAAALSEHQTDIDSITASIGIATLQRVSGRQFYMGGC